MLNSSPDVATVAAIDFGVLLAAIATEHWNPFTGERIP